MKKYTAKKNKKTYQIKTDLKHVNENVTLIMSSKTRLKLYYYTINNTQNLKKAKALYADGIFSDYPNILD